MNPRLFRTRRPLTPPEPRTPWTLVQPTDPVERIVIVGLSNALLYATVKFLPNTEPGPLTLGALLLNFALLTQVALRTPIGAGRQTALPHGYQMQLPLPLSLLLLVATVALSVPGQITAMRGNAGYQDLPWRTPVTFQLQGTGSVTLPLRAQGLVCLLHRRRVVPVQVPGTLPLQPQVNFRQGRSVQAVTGFDLSTEVRQAAMQIPAVTLAALSCQSPWPGGVINDLQTTRRNNVLTIDGDLR